MFSWITGPRITNVIEDLQTDPAYDTTFVEPPDTPAPQFAVKAFKQALWGTPAPQESRVEKKEKHEERDTRKADLPAPKEDAPPCSPSKQPGGILMTPRTTGKGRKTVSFGAHVVDNEAKKGAVGKSGIPNDCPGKFPSPWTPGTELRADTTHDTKPLTKLTAALYDARSVTQTASGQKPRARDDSDITLDMSTPRSESGKYWKEKYETYAERSQKQMKQLVTKQQIARNYAKKKDDEAMAAETKLAGERKRFRKREQELEQQNKEYQERLRQAMAQNTAASVEITALKNRIVALEKSLATSSSDVQNSKMSFQIFEDPSKGSSLLDLGQHKPSEAQPRGTMEPPAIILARPVQSSGIRTEDKENSPPKIRRTGRLTLPDTASQPTRAHAAEPTYSAGAPTTSTRSPRIPVSAVRHTPISTRKLQQSKENLPPKSPLVPASSPLPQPSPDPWADLNNESPLPTMDRMAMPISSGLSYSRATKPLGHRHRVSKSVAHSTNVSKEAKFDTAKPDAATTQASAPQESKADDSKLSSRPVEHSSLLKTKGTLPLDRKAEAKRRLEERKQKRMASS